FQRRIFKQIVTDRHLLCTLVVDLSNISMMRGLRRSQTVKVLLLLATAAGLCPAQFAPFNASNYAAKVITQSGQVSVFKDAQPWALSVGDSVQARDLILTGPDGHAILQVSDGSNFEVFPNSRVVFRKNPPN